MMQRRSNFAGQGTPSSSQVITALPSTLGSKAAPTLPPASSTYEPLAKGILKQRFERQVLLSALGAVCINSVFWTSWDAGSISSLGLLSFVRNCLSPVAIALTLAWAAFAVLPVVWQRKRHLQASGSPALSPSGTISANLKDARYIEFMFTLYASVMATTTCHALMADLLSVNKAGLGIWAGSRKHPLHLNGRLLFLFLSQSSAAILYWLRDLLRSRFTIRWAKETSYSAVAIPAIMGSLISVALLSILSSTLSLAAFGLLRSLALPIIYRFPVLHSILRPFIAHFLRPTLTITFLWTNADLVVRSFLLTFSAQMSWEVASTLFDVAVSMPVRVSGSSSNSSLMLVSGLGSSSSYFQFQVLHELAEFSSSSDEAASTKRQALFNDSKHSPSLWASVCRHGLLLLGRDYQHFIRRGQPVPVPVVPKPAPAPSIPNLPSTPINKGNVYKAPRPSPLGALADSLASDSALTNVLTHGTSDQLDLSVIADNVLRPLRKSVSPSQGVKAIAPSAEAEVQKVRAAVESSVLVPVKGVRSSWDRWFTRERIDRAAVRNLPHKDLDILIVQTLSHLVSNSLREDGFGHVQRDIPRVLEALVLFLTAIEVYHAELNALSEASNPPITKDVHLTEIARAAEWVDELATELRTGLGLIVNTFGDRLNKFRFPTHVASELQKFADYAP